MVSSHIFLPGKDDIVFSLGEIFFLSFWFEVEFFCTQFGFFASDNCLCYTVLMNND